MKQHEERSCEKTCKNACLHNKLSWRNPKKWDNEDSPAFRPSLGIQTWTVIWAKKKPALRSDASKQSPEVTGVLLPFAFCFLLRLKIIEKLGPLQKGNPNTESSTKRTGPFGHLYRSLKSSCLLVGGFGVGGCLLLVVTFGMCLCAWSVFL